MTGAGVTTTRDSPSCVETRLSPKKLEKNLRYAIHWAGESCAPNRKEMAPEREERFLGCGGAHRTKAVSVR
jgi:hypothetical protein